MSYLGNAFNGSWTCENSYVIIDDTNMSEGVTIDRDESDTIGEQQEQTQKPQTAQQTSSTSKDNIITKDTLPKTGVSNAIYIIMTSSFILLVIFGIKIKKYKDINYETYSTRR